MTSATKNAVFPVIAAGLLLAAGVAAGVTGSQQQAQLDAKQATLSKLGQQQVAAREATKQVEADMSVAGDGAQAGRVTKDSKVIDDIADRALTWDSDATYRQARSSTMRVYKLAEDDTFVQSFLPPAPVNTDSKGNVYPYIDAAGLNSSVGDVTVRLLGVAGTKYSYMALVDVRSASSDDLGSDVNVATIFVTIDDSGTVSSLTGYASTTKVRSSL